MAGVSFKVTVSPAKRVGGRRMTARSPALDRDMHRRRAVAVVGVEADAGVWRPSPFQLHSWGEYLRDQPTIKAALATALRDDLAGWWDAAAGNVWRAFSATAVALDEPAATSLPPRAVRRHTLATGFLTRRVTAADVNRLLDAQERRYTGGASSLYTVALDLVDNDHAFYASFRDAQLIDLVVDG